MAHSVSAKKRIRQNARRRQLNRARKSRMKTEIRKVKAAADAGQADQFAVQLRAASKRIDQVAAKGAIHKNKAARLKSRLARRASQLKSD